MPGLRNVAPMPSSGDDRGSTVIWSMWMMVVVCLVFVAARIYTRTIILRNMGWDDYLLIVCWVRVLQKTECVLKLICFPAAHKRPILNFLYSCRWRWHGTPYGRTQAVRSSRHTPTHHNRPELWYSVSRTHQDHTWSLPPPHYHQAMAAHCCLVANGDRHVHVQSLHHLPVAPEDTRGDCLQPIHHQV